MRSLFVILCILYVFLNVSVSCFEGTCFSPNNSSPFCLRDFILTITPKYGIIIERNKFILFKTHENRPFITVGYAFHMEKLGNHRGNFNIKEWMLFQTSYQTITSATQPSHNEIVIIGEVFGSFLRASYSLRFFIPEQVSNTNSKTSASYLTKQIAFDLHVRAKRGQFNRIGDIQLVRYTTQLLVRYTGEVLWFRSAIQCVERERATYTNCGIRAGNWSRHRANYNFLKSFRGWSGRRLEHHVRTKTILFDEP